MSADGRTKGWPDGMPVAQVRIARPTDRLEEVTEFYRDGIGLVELGSFGGHYGYEGVMLGLPGNAYHLEFTRHEDGSPSPVPSRENLLVLYIPNREAIESVRSRLSEMGYEAVAPENPWWEEKGVTIEDPDGWRIVLFDDEGIRG